LQLQSNGVVALSTSGANVTIANQLSLTTGLTITAAVSSLYTTDGTLSRYSTSNGVYLNGNSAGWLALQGDGTQATTLLLYGATEASLPNTISLKTGGTERLRVKADGVMTFYGQGATASGNSTIYGMVDNGLCVSQVTLTNGQSIGATGGTYNGGMIIVIAMNGGSYGTGLFISGTSTALVSSTGSYTFSSTFNQASAISLAKNGSNRGPILTNNSGGTVNFTIWYFGGF
jgi:hypothetical protein